MRFRWSEFVRTREEAEGAIFESQEQRFLAFAGPLPPDERFFCIHVMTQLLVESGIQYVFSDEAQEAFVHLANQLRSLMSEAEKELVDAAATEGRLFRDAFSVGEEEMAMILSPRLGPEGKTGTESVLALPGALRLPPEYEGVA